MQRLHRNILLAALGFFWLSPPAAPGSLGDERLEAAVEAALTRSESLSEIAGLKVQCDEGILTLRGTVKTLYTLDQAVRQAGTVAGVVDVVVTAAVPRLGIPDSEILAGVRQALQTPSFSFVNIQASVGGGRVALTGTCGSYSQKLLAEREISKIPGVVQVQNRIAVTAQANASEERLARLVLSRLTGPSGPAEGLFRVSIRGSVAILTGRVPLYLSRLEAEETALGVPGIQQVDNRLVVDPLLGPPPSAPTQP
ncbi:MAG: BON domain-containing protein [Acidobacteria bacterium]|nr:BON domain-containing protein [Acidobacteriota bacterium]